MDLIEVRAERMVAGGDAIARDVDGRVVLVEGALPGELVRAEIVEERRDLVRARTIDVVDASTLRVAPPCPAVALGCGGCSWQHVDAAAQASLKVDIVRDSLRRIAHVEDIEIDVVEPESDGRTTVRAAIADGRPALHRRHSHDLVPVDACLASHPLVEEVLVHGRFEGASDVTVRCGARTGDRLVVVAPKVEQVYVPTGTVVVTKGAKAERAASIREEATGRSWRISAQSFFQSSPEVAEALVDAVHSAVGPLAPADHVVDAYAGVGLFAGAVAGAAATRITAIESHPAAAADARVNLADVDAHVIRCEVAKWRPSPADVVIADPARPGLGRSAARALAAARARVIALVSCDPASFARDVALLAGLGYRLTTVTLVDAFPHTFHVETVARFARIAT